MKEPPPPSVSSRREYRRVVADQRYWEPWVRWALFSADFNQPKSITPGRDLSYPTFVCDTGVVVKLFSPLFSGSQSYEAEAEAYSLLSGHGLPVPQLKASGEMYPGHKGWRWPYLVLGRLMGAPLSSLQRALDRAETERIARQIGVVLARLHKIPLTGRKVLAKDWKRFLALLRSRRERVVKDHLRWGHLSPEVAAELEEFLSQDMSNLIDTRTDPVFVHADLHAEHIFIDQGLRRLVGIIDFTDALAGDPRYDLVALHLGSFGADKELLSICLDSYGWPPRGDGWPEEMLHFTLLHAFDVLADIPGLRNRLKGAESPEALARLLWDIDAPGFDEK